MQIEEATRETASHWKQMRDALWPDSASGNANEIERYFAGVSRDIRQCYIATREGRPAGFIELNVRNYAEGSKQAYVPYVEGWFVDEQCRGQGIGAALMQVAEAWARREGYSELASDAELANEASIAAHQRLGFEETDRIVCFVKKLP